MRLTMIVLSMAVTISALTQAEEPAYELRGVWLNPYAFNDENRAETLNKIVSANLNTIFIAASPPVNGSHGHLDPEDYAETIRSAKSLGLSVHGWICCQRRLGKARTVDFTNPEEQEAQKQWALDLLAKYPDLDGIHLDYIRYYKWSKCDAAKMEGLESTIRRTYDAIKRRHPDKFLTVTSFIAASANYHGSSKGRRLEWTGDVPQWFRNWYSTNPENWYAVQHRSSKQVRREWLLGPVHFNFQQDPVSWIQEGIVDSVMSMQYSSSQWRWRNEVNLWKSFLSSDLDKVCIGLGWLVEEGHREWKYDPAALVKHIKYGRSQGVKGFVIFQLTSPQLPRGVDDWELVRALSVDSEINDGDAPFEKPAPSPLSRGDIIEAGR